MPSAPSVPTPARREFAELAQRVRDAGLLDRRTGYYVAKIAFNIAALGVVTAAAVVAGRGWWNLAEAAGLAFVLSQLAFVGHDAGHRQVLSSRRGNDIIGLLHANLLTGFSFGWWLEKHNRHHAHTNRVGKDPDIGAGALSFTPDQTLGRSGAGRCWVRTQAAMLAPLLLAEALNLHVASIIDLVRRRDRAALIESTLLATHFTVFFGGPFLLWGPWHAAAFVVVTQALFGLYLGSTFVTNHVGMPVLAGTDDLGFLRRQVLTSRNLSGGRTVAFLSGGLSLQVEHHLFPHLPRANLHRVQPLVRSYCAEVGVAYHEQSPLVAYRDVLRHLHSVGAARLVPITG